MYLATCMLPRLLPSQTRIHAAVADAGEGMQQLRQLPGLLKRLDRGLKGLRDSLTVRTKMQVQLLEDHLAERLG